MAAAGERPRTTLQQRVALLLEGGGRRRLGGRLVFWLLLLLILGNVADVALDTLPGFYDDWRPVLVAFQIFSMIVFTLEFAARLWVAGAVHGEGSDPPSRARLRYLGSFGWIDLAVVLPFYAGLISGEPLRFQVLRLLLLLKLSRFSTAMGTLGRVLGAEWRALVGSLIIMLSLLMLSATGMYYLEHGEQPQQFSSIPAAMWWAMAALSTVGYGDVVPVTPLGRVFGGIVTVLGIGVYALPVGIIASGFAREIQRRDFVVTWGMVARVPLFKGLDAEQVARVASLLRSRVVTSGTTIVRKGEPGDCMYFIAAGSAEVQIQPHPVRLSDGDFFGEMALLLDAPRSASVAALSRCQLLILDADDFRSLAQGEPRIGAAIREIAERRLKATVPQPG
ncbi:MAG: ion transporter [Dongiaceae bacterium]